jgi:hypothetical protein
MADPKLEEFTRASSLQPQFLHALQRYVRETVQPQLEERERLLEENARLKTQLERADRTRKPERPEKEVAA